MIIAKVRSLLTFSCRKFVSNVFGLATLGTFMGFDDKLESKQCHLTLATANRTLSTQRKMTIMSPSILSVLCNVLCIEIKRLIFILWKRSMESTRVQYDSITINCGVMIENHLFLGNNVVKLPKRFCHHDSTDDRPS